MRLNAWNTNPTSISAQLGEGPLVERGEIDVADEHAARRRRVESRHAVQERRLPGPGRSHDRGELCLGELDRHAPQGFDGGVAPAVDLDQVDRSCGDGRRRRRGHGHVAPPARVRDAVGRNDTLPNKPGHAVGAARTRRGGRRRPIGRVQAARRARGRGRRGRGISLASMFIVAPQATVMTKSATTAITNAITIAKSFHSLGPFPTTGRTISRLGRSGDAVVGRAWSLASPTVDSRRASGGGPVVGAAGFEPATSRV